MPLFFEGNERCQTWRSVSSNLDICSSGMSQHLLLAQSIPITTLDYPVRPVVAHFKHTLLGLAAMLSKHGGWKWNYDTCVISLRSPKPRV